MDKDDKERMDIQTEETETDAEELMENAAQPEEDEGARASRMMFNWKVIGTVVIIVLGAMFCLHSWDSDGSYPVNLKSEKGAAWQCVSVQQERIEVSPVKGKDGKDSFELTGKELGKCKVVCQLQESGNPSSVRKTVEYYFEVMKGNQIRFLKMQRHEGA